MSTADLSPAHRAVLDALDEPWMVAELQRLIRVPSITGSDAESELQDEMARQLVDLDMDVDLWKLDLAELEADPESPGVEAPRSEGYGLVGATAGEGDIGFILQGHIDVVPTGDLGKWDNADPFSGQIIGDVLHGRGACDMKAGVVANMAVAKALAASGLRFEKRFAIHQVISEEDGGLGAFATMRRGHTGEACVITEPTSGRIVVANAGALTFEIRVPGRAAHGSTRYEGVSAFEAFWPIHHALREARSASTPAAAPCSRATRCRTASRSARSPPATGPAPSPTCSSPRDASESRSTPTRPTRGSSSRRPSPTPAARTPGCRPTPPPSRGPGASSGPDASPTTTRSSTRWPAPSSARRGHAPRSARHPTVPTCASTSGSAASPRCTTGPATSAWHTRRANR